MFVLTIYIVREWKAACMLYNHMQMHNAYLRAVLVFAWKNVVAQLTQQKYAAKLANTVFFHT